MMIAANDGILTTRNSAIVAWEVDLQVDVCGPGNAFKNFPIVDEHICECIGGLASRSITADCCIDPLQILIAERIDPAALAEKQTGEYYPISCEAALV